MIFLPQQKTSRGKIGLEGQDQLFLQSRYAKEGESERSVNKYVTENAQFEVITVRWNAEGSFSIWISTNSKAANKTALFVFVFRWKWIWSNTAAMTAVFEIQLNLNIDTALFQYCRNLMAGWISFFPFQAQTGVSTFFWIQFKIVIEFFLLGFIWFLYFAFPCFSFSWLIEGICWDRLPS